MKTLAIDIGGTGIKATLLDSEGAPLAAFTRVPTPRPATPDAVLLAIATIAANTPEFDRISVGFPGLVGDGVTYDAPNLHPNWAGFPLALALTEQLRRPARVLNDADVQGFGAIEGRGVELVVTLGTGVGSALFLDGRLLPNLELGHHLWRDNLSYEAHLGMSAFQRLGAEAWRALLREAIQHWLEIFNPRKLYLGGGHAQILGGDLPPQVEVVSNDAGLLGGIALWRTQL